MPPPKPNQNKKKKPFLCSRNTQSIGRTINGSWQNNTLLHREFPRELIGSFQVSLGFLGQKRPGQWEETGERVWGGGGQLCVGKWACHVCVVYMAWDVWCMCTCLHTLGLGGSVGLLWPGKQGMGALWPLGVTPSPLEVTALLHHLWLPRRGLSLSVRDPLFLFNKPRAPQPTAEQPQAVTENCCATLISPLEAKWGKWCTLSGTWPVHTPIELVPVAWKTLLKDLLPPASEGPQPCVHPQPPSNNPKLGLATCGLLPPTPKLELF